MKETMHFILEGKNQLLGIPTLYLEPKMKNEFSFQRTFKCEIVSFGPVFTISKVVLGQFRKKSTIMLIFFPKLI